MSIITTTLYNVLTFNWTCLFPSCSLAHKLFVLANDWFAIVGWDKTNVVSKDPKSTNQPTNFLSRGMLLFRNLKLLTSFDFSWTLSLNSYHGYPNSNTLFDCMNLPNDMGMLAIVLSSSYLQWTLTIICYKSWRELPTKQILKEKGTSFAYVLQLCLLSQL
jgi:hypothetical protein